MKTTIKTKKFGDVTFFTGNGTRYIYVDLNKKSGSLGNQICAGGHLTGSTMAYIGDDLDQFGKICRNWWAKYLKNERTI